MQVKKLSVFYKVLLINAGVSLVLICIFLFNFLYYSARSKQETDNYANHILLSVTQRYNDELNRLMTLTNMCVTDPSIILAASDTVPAVSSSQYTDEAEQKLKMISYSLPYSQSIFVYSKNRKKFIFTNTMATVSQYNIMKNKGQPLGVFPAEMTLFDFDNLGPGFYQINEDSCVYITNILNYGLLVIKVDTARFCNFTGINALLPDYSIALLDDHGKIFSVSSLCAVGLLKDIDLKNYNSKEITINSAQYSLMQRVANNNFRFVLIGQPSRLQNLQKGNSLFGIFVPMAVFLVCVALIAVNATIYNPLRKIARKFGSANKNEIEFISGKVTQLATENELMQQKIHLQQTTLADIELNYAISSKGGISSQLVDQLKSLYEQYKIVVVALQGKGGNGAEQLLPVDDSFIGTFQCKTVVIDPFAHAYLINDTLETDEIVVKIQECFKSVEPDVQAYAGISDLSKDFFQVNRHYMQAYERMLNNRVPDKKVYAINGRDCEDSKSNTNPVSFEVQSTIGKCTLNGSHKDLESIFSHLFFPQTPLKLKHAISMYRQISNLLLVVMNPADSSLQYEDMNTSTNTLIYNVEYMYTSLIEDFTKLNRHNTMEHTTLRYGITDYITKHYQEPLSLESISEEFGITPVYLSAWFKKNTGINLSTYLSNIRMEAAKLIMSENKHIKITDLSIKVGIPSASAFNRQFRNYTGMTPDQYRQK